MKARRWTLAGVGLVAAVALLPAAAQASVSAAWSPQTSAGTYDFGQITAGTTAAKTFKLTNSGTTKTGALRIRILGRPVYTKSLDTCKGKSLAKGKSCQVRITYAPPSQGESDSVTLEATNVANTLTYASLTLSGSTTVTGAPDIIITPTTSAGFYDFGSDAKTVLFDITNDGTGNAWLSQLSYAAAGTLPGGTTGANDSCGIFSHTPLGPGKTCAGQFTVTFTPLGDCSTNIYEGELGVAYGPSLATDGAQNTVLDLQAEEPFC